MSGRIQLAALSVSVAAHLGLAWGLTVAEPGEIGDRVRPEPTVLAVEVRHPRPEPAARPAPEPPPEPAPPSEARPVPDRRPRLAAATRRPDRRDERERRDEGEQRTAGQASAATGGASDGTEGSPSESQVEVIPGPSAEELRRRLDPAAVARAALLPSGMDEADLPRDEADARGRALSRSLRQQANAKPWLSRTEPELVPGPGGTYRYDGHVFRAIVQPDGTVRFRDRMGDRSSLGKGSASVRFDLNDAVSRARGEDPYAAERRWFLERTEALRERLAREHHAERMGHSVAALRGRLRRLWKADAPPAERRRRIFRLWDGMSEDETGERGREAIERFVREHLPRSDPRGFDASELARLNAARSSDTRFAPYAP